MPTAIISLPDIPPLERQLCSLSRHVCFRHISFSCCRKRCRHRREEPSAQPPPFQFDNHRNSPLPSLLTCRRIAGSPTAKSTWRFSQRQRHAPVMLTAVSAITIRGSDPAASRHIVISERTRTQSSQKNTPVSTNGSAWSNESNGRLFAASPPAHTRLRYVHKNQRYQSALRTSQLFQPRNHEQGTLTKRIRAEMHKTHHKCRVLIRSTIPRRQNVQ